MKWPLLLGIISVILLQSSFTAYNALYRPFESLFTVNELTRGTNPIVNEMDKFDAWNAGAYTERFANRNRENSVFTSTNVRNRVRPTVVARPVFVKADSKPPATKRISAMQLVAMQKPFESVTITYQQPMRTGREVEDYSVQSVRFSENRSFFSKSVSVIKKPLKWVKALGSKLK
ncbi:MAG: hypothetical protein ACKVRN_02530 [Pyrinomonadaceae bacterium]